MSVSTAFYQNMRHSGRAVTSMITRLVLAFKQIEAKIQMQLEDFISNILLPDKSDERNYVHIKKTGLEEID